MTELNHPETCHVDLITSRWIPLRATGLSRASLVYPSRSGAVGPSASDPVPPRCRAGPLLLVFGDAGEHIVDVLWRSQEDGRALVDGLRLDVEDADRAVTGLAAGLETSDGRGEVRRGSVHTDYG